MGKDKLDILEKIHKDRVHRLSQEDEKHKIECEESEKYIKEMQEMEVKREAKYNTIITIVVGAFVVLCIIIAANSISHFKNSKAKIATEKRQEQINKINTNKQQLTKDKNVKKKVQVKKVEPVNKIDYAKKITASLNTEDSRNKLLNDALRLTGGKYVGLNIKYMVAILRGNGVNLPTNIDRTDTLVQELQKQGWKKNTNPNDLQKGDIVFTTDTVGVSGVPSCVYVFMGWKDSKKQDAYIVSALNAEDKITYSSRNVTAQTETTDKFQFFMNK